jgi:hypothetical protein
MYIRSSMRLFSVGSKQQERYVHLLQLGSHFRALRRTIQITVHLQPSILVQVIKYVENDKDSGQLEVVFSQRRTNRRGS